MIRRTYLRCNSGHYFDARETSCPLDGWALDGMAILRIVLLSWLDKTEALTINELALAGVSPEVLARTAIVEFGEESAAFETLVPEAYLIDDKLVTMRQVPPRLL